MLRNIQGWPLVIIILSIIILVGWKRLPDAARSVGRSMRIFKSEVEQMSNSSSDEGSHSAASSDMVDGQARRNDSHRNDSHRSDPLSNDSHRSDSHRSDPLSGDSRHDSDIQRSGTDERSN